MSVKVSAPVAYLVHAMLLSFSNAVKRWPEQMRHTLVGFLPVTCAAGQEGGNNDLVETEDFLDGYLLLFVVEVRD